METYHAILLRHGKAGTEIADELKVNRKREKEGGLLWSQGMLYVVMPVPREEESGKPSAMNGEPFLVSGTVTIPYGQALKLNPLVKEKGKGPGDEPQRKAVWVPIKDGKFDLQAVVKRK
jgi:hypothetical protein